MDNLLQRLEALEDEVRTVERRLRLWRLLAGSVLVLMLVTLLQPWGFAAQTSGEDPERTLWQIVNLWGRVGAIEQTLTHVTRMTGTDGLPEVRITGANLRLVNGLRSTATANGLGNLLVGYSEPRQGENVQTGSHNVVVGQGHHFSSFGGLVVGRQNEISGAFAVVSGGFDNTASGASATVCGGIFNRASGESAVVSGGFDNTASANAASVNGGAGNMASGDGTTVCGGHGNTASGTWSAVSGGEMNTASGFTSSVSGGRNRTVRGDFDWVAGTLFADE